MVSDDEYEGFEIQYSQALDIQKKNLLRSLNTGAIKKFLPNFVDLCEELVQLDDIKIVTIRLILLLLGNLQLVNPILVTRRVK